MLKKDKKFIEELPCDYHYKENLIKFMEFSESNLSTSLDFIFDYFFTGLKELVLNKKVPRFNSSLKRDLKELFK